MIVFLADENFDGDVVRGLRRSDPAVDVVTVQEVGLTSASDQDVLEWAARQGRVLLTHDMQTMAGFAYDRVGRGLRMPGVLEVHDGYPCGQAIEDILLLATCGTAEDVEGQVRYLPLRW